MENINPYLSTITLSVSGITFQSKDRECLNVLKKIQQYAAYKRATWALKTHTDWEQLNGIRCFKQMFQNNSKSRGTYTYIRQNRV